MKNNRRVVRDARSAISNACLIEPLEVRQVLSATIPNVLPLGDSITQAFTGHASYRYWLWNSLADAGYMANFVGTGAGVGDGPPLHAGFDSDHEGHSGFRADDIQKMVESAAWKTFALLPQNKPDIVLLHIGSNDLEQGQTAASTRNEIGKIIDDLRVINPKVTILLAQIIPETNVSVTSLNSLLPALATSKNTTQSRVIVVDQATGFAPATDTYDGVHPTEAGEKKIASKWLTALTPLLPAPTPPPAGVYLGTVAVPLTNSTNAFGPVEHELSNGSDSQYDGQMLTLRGQTYMRGFGVHAPAELDFDLSGGTYSNFRAIVGVDDEVTPNGSVVFQIFVNNETTARYSSPVQTGASAPLAIDVNISGAKSLRLVVTDSGNDNDFDHADWIQARLIAGTTTNPPPTPSGDAPSAPKKLRAVFAGGKVNLCWKDTADNELGFHVERKVGANGSWQQIANLGANAHAFRDTKLSAGSKYYYRVSAYNADGESVSSNTDIAVVPACKKKVKKVKPKHDNDQNENAIENKVAKIIEKLKAVLSKIVKR